MGEDDSDPITAAVSQTLSEVEKGSPKAAEELLPLVYQELRNLAQGRLARLHPGQTVQATELVHEAWLRILAKGDPGWNSKAHFFGAASRAIRNILVDQARRKSSLKRDVKRKQELAGDEPLIESGIADEDVLSLHESLERLEVDHERAAKVVSLRFFGGLSMPEVAELMQISLATAEREWRFARSWLQREMGSAVM